MTTLEKMRALLAAPDDTEHHVRASRVIYAYPDHTTLNNLRPAREGLIHALVSRSFTDPELSRL
jgi:hypothetical protein